MRSDDTPFALVTLLLIAIALGVLVVRYFRGLPKAPAPDRPSQALPALGPDGEPAVVECPCRAPATRPVPRTRARVTWWDALLRRLGVPLTYEQGIPIGAPLAVCDNHGRTLDALLHSKRTTVVATRRAECEVGIASDLAAYESEGLMRDLVESLTAEQKRRRPSLRVVRNGTTDTTEPSS